MKRGLFLVAWSLCALTALAEDFRVRVQEQVTIEAEGATAAYLVDPTIADAVVTQTGTIVLTGRTIGSTQLVAVSPTATRAFAVVVTPGAVSIRRAAAIRNGGLPAAIYDGRYASEAGQAVNAFDVFMRDEERLSQFHLVNVHYFRQHFGGADTVFPSVFYNITTPRRQITFLDQFVDVSPLTLQYAQLRGFHWIDRSGLELHAGVAAPSMYEGVFLPVDGRWAAGAGYAMQRGRWRFIPSVYGFFSEPPNTAARRGAVAAFISEYITDTFFARAEVGEGNGSVGASTEFRYNTPKHQANGKIVYKPEKFPSLGLVDLRGVHGDVNWNSLASRRLTLMGFASYDRFTLPFGDDRSAVGHFDFRYRFTNHFSYLGGLYASDLRTRDASFRTVEVPTGLGFDSRRFGADVIYRFIQTSGTSRRGDALRADVRAGGPRLQATLWAERDRQVPTLDLIFRQDPALQTALLRLGISVRTPEDLARVLRDNPVLIDLGFIEGVTVNLAPRQLLGGFDAAWSSASGVNRIFLNTTYDRIEGVAQTNTIAIGTLGAAFRVFGLTDLYGAWTRWRSSVAGSSFSHSSYEVGLRTSVSRLPALFHRSGPIEGYVFLDPKLSGAFTAPASPLQGVSVVLDGVETAHTDRAGHYIFRGIRSGTHNVSAQLPPGKSAFFTTASHVDVEAGSRVDFGLVWSPARLSGRIVSDANLGIAGVAVLVTSKNRSPMRLTSEGSGEFRADLPEGDYEVDLATESLPPGYVAADGLKHSAHLVAQQPVHIVFPVTALRSVAGIAAPGAVIELQPLGRTTTADASGNFVFRSLPAGTFTLRTRSGGHAAEKMVVLPEEPASMHDVNLMLPGKVPPVRIMAASAPVRPTSGQFLVQAGAFRVQANAQATVQRLRQLGVEPSTENRNGLTLVYVGPFASREAAASVMEKLRDAGVDAVVAPIR